MSLPLPLRLSLALSLTLSSSRDRCFNDGEGRRCPCCPCRPSPGVSGGAGVVDSSQVARGARNDGADPQYVCDTERAVGEGRRGAIHWKSLLFSLRPFFCDRVWCERNRYELKACPLYHTHTHTHTHARHTHTPSHTHHDTRTPHTIAHTLLLFFSLSLSLSLSPSFSSAPFPSA